MVKIDFDTDFAYKCVLEDEQDNLLLLLYKAMQNKDKKEADKIKERLHELHRELY